MKNLLLIMIMALTPLLSKADGITDCDTFPNGSPKWTLEVFNEGTEFAYYTYTSYYKSGQIARVGDLNEYGKRHGTWRTYYEDGSKHSVINYKSGKRHGEQYAYARNGKVVLYGEYKDGMRHGKFRAYDPFGDKLISEKLFKRDKLRESYEWHEEKGGLLIVKL